MIEDAELLKQLQSGAARPISRLGFFSQPFRMQDDAEHTWVVKPYRPLSSQRLAAELSSAHERYLQQLRLMGLRLPDTHMRMIPDGSRIWPVVVQASFAEKELLRGRMESAEQDEYLQYLEALWGDVDKYRTFLAGSEDDLGFHPTTRNYAWREEQLWFFDTFPPMAMPQRELNRWIVRMAPVRFPLRRWVPQRWVNRVSDEYYQVAPMLLGIVGSACRLRPEYCPAVMAWARERAATGLPEGDLRDQVLAGLQRPPRLEGIWTTFRRLWGKEGRPNLPG